jgi:Fe2+ or Zn2+ uptake regulation protein
VPDLPLAGAPDRSLAGGNKKNKGDRRVRTNQTLLVEIQLEVLRYLDENPKALDTTEGIHQWWLQSAFSGYAAESVQAALDQLAIYGFIDSQLFDDGQTAYYRGKALSMEEVPPSDKKPPGTSMN